MKHNIQHNTKVNKEKTFVVQEEELSSNDLRVNKQMDKDIQNIERNSEDNVINNIIMYSFIWR